MEEAANDSSFDPKPDDQDTKGKGKRKRSQYLIFVDITIGQCRPSVCRPGLRLAGSSGDSRGRMGLTAPVFFRFSSDPITALILQRHPRPRQSPPPLSRGLDLREGECLPRRRRRPRPG